MRKLHLKIAAFCTLLFLTFFALSSSAQITEAEKNTALDLVNRNKSVIGLNASELENSVVTATYIAPTGLRMVFLQQTFKGILVHNQIHVLAFRGDQVVSIAGNRVAAIEKKINSTSYTPSISVQDAVLASLSESKISTMGLRGSLANPSLNAMNKLDFGRLGVVYENITAELKWMPVSEQEWKLAWEILVTPERTDDAWMISVDALNGSIIGKTNITVYDNWGKAIHDIPFNYVMNRAPVERNLEYQVPLINSATYLVIKYPAESPQHPGGTASLHTDPWTWTPGNASTLKWHSDGTDYNITRGNNVWATEDRTAANQNTGLPATSSTPDPLTFNFPPDYTVAPTTPAFQQFAITNLFYWNNFLHDVHYVYGFDEVSGNFQTNNLGRGGVGNDNVSALAQSGAGTNNANFLTLPDGQRGRMRMYLFTAPNPDRDGDLDNGVMCHEFGHGISNRLTGGPATAGSCLSNAEEGGEGWGDYYALMFTTNWATATVNDGPIPRAMGTYVLNQPTSGAGIRNYRYSTDMAVNPLTYASMGVPPIGTEVHNIGEIWCMALWEMTWSIIQQTNTINPNIMNPSGAGGIGGNSIALKLVLEGMR